MNPIWQAVILGAASFVVTLLVAGYVYQVCAERQESRKKPAPGIMISIGTRRLHLFTTGSAGPTVVIEQGAAEPARLWWPVQLRIAEFARVCTYDRAGYGWSDAVPAGRRIEDRVDDLRALLTNARLPAPFVFVAHSYGGFIVRRFAERYPHLTAGLVLVDTAEEGTFFRPEVLKFYSRVQRMLKVAVFAARFGLLRLLAKRYQLDDMMLPFVCSQEYSTAIDDLASLDRVSSEWRRSKAPGSLGDMPLAVITHGLPFPGPLAVVEDGWSDGQARLAALSKVGTLTVAANSSHMIHLDEPAVVVDAIRRIHTAARAHASRSSA